MILSLRDVGLVMALVAALVSASFAQERDEPVELLSPEQINVIKVWELPVDLQNARVTVRIPRQVMQEVFDQYRDAPQVPKGRAEQQAFLRRPMLEQLDLLFDLAPQNPSVRAYYKDIHVNGEPASMIEFRRQVYGNYVQRYFRRHFGDGQVPGVRLVNAPAKALPEMYTNFYILSMVQIDGIPMIDRRNVRDSLLLQWGLPRESAKYPAPEVEGWRAHFRGLNDDNFERIAAVLEQLYDAPNYDLDYPLPGQAQ